MQKKILLFVVCITMTGVAVHAQHKKNLPPPPPPPPVPPIEMIAEPAPPPPAPPLPPIPPEPPVPAKGETITVNSNGYDIHVETPKGIAVVVVEKNGVTQKIRLSTWNANRKFYEKKYGLLPPPPPPPFPGEIEKERIEVAPDMQ